ncbi:MAG: tyrosine-type recombinase/integrase [Candidatus Korobacteraceae bacterium]
MRGFRIEDYTGDRIQVKRAVWRSQVKAPKTTGSSRPIPVIPVLAKFLDQHIATSGRSAGYLFASPQGQPLNLDALAVEVIRPVLEKIGIKWHGWHAFRRGLATNLHRLGVPGKTIQQILRHAHLSTTMDIYVKSDVEEAAAAMQKLEALCATVVQPQPPNSAHIV